MADGDAELSAFIERLKAFGKGAEEAAAKEAAPLVQEAARATAAAGTDPYGKAWPARKDGSRAMPNAAENITATAHGSIVRIVATGGIAVQNYLKARRQVVPDAGKMPPAILAALHEGARRAFQKAFG